MDHQEMEQRAAMVSRVILGPGEIKEHLVEKEPLDPREMMESQVNLDQIITDQDQMGLEDPKVTEDRKEDLDQKENLGLQELMNVRFWISSGRCALAVNANVDHWTLPSLWTALRVLELLTLPSLKTSL